MRKLLVATGLGLAPALALAACGARAPLEPAPGQALPPAPLAQNEPPTADELLGLPAQARPERVDELLTESEERQDDRFDLPPD
jgi:predicted small lipoprotein YifL